MSDEDSHEQLKKAVLSYIQKRFEEIEQDLAMSHQDKYAKLEDSLEGSTDESELKVAFERWYREHRNDISIEEEVDELWEQVLVHHDLK
ncbi:MAG: hypothetical protein ABEJ02_03195 [Candidatus Paceibacteria bacterium]